MGSGRASCYFFLYPFLILLALTLPLTLRASGEPIAYGSFGFLLQNLYTTSQTSYSDAGTVGGSYIDLGVTVDLYRPGPEWSLSGTVHATPLGRSLQDEAGTVRIFRGGFLFNRKFGSIALRMGTGIFSQWTVGSGGTTQLRNGSSVSTFGLPGRSSFGYTLYFQAGALFSVTDRFIMEADVISIASFSKRREFCFNFSGGFYF